MDIENLLSEDDNLQAQETEQKEEPKQEVDIAKQVNETLIDTLASLAQTQPAPRQQMQAVSALDAAIADLESQNIPRAAIDNYLKLQGAIEYDKSVKQQAMAAENALKQYESQVWQTAFDSIQEVGANVKVIANGGKGLREDLAGAMSDLIATDPKFKGLKASIASFQTPDKIKMKEAARVVIDRYLSDNGIAKPAGGLDISSSKPDKRDNSVFDEGSLNKAQRQIYESVLKHVKDPKLAQKRALELR